MFMRIAFVTFEYPPFIIGGAGVYAVNITRELARLGHKLTVFAPKIATSYDEPEVDNLEVKRVKISKSLPFSALQFWLALPKAIKNSEKDGEFDVIHFNGISYGFIKRRLSKALHIITIHHLCIDAVQSYNLSFLYRLVHISSEMSVILPFIERRCLNYPDHIIAVSNYTKEQIIKTYKINSGKIKVIHNGFDNEVKGFEENDFDEIKSRFNLDGRPIILFVGRVDDFRKGLDILFKAFKEVLAEVDAYLLVVGKGDQGPAKELAKSLCILDNIIFAGFLSDEDLKKCYELCDVYASPSRLEGFGLTILEAMASGKPIVATNVGAIPELIEDGKNGILTNPEDQEGMAQAVLSILSNKGMSRELMKGSLALLNDKFNWEKTANEINSIYYAT